MAEDDENVDATLGNETVAARVQRLRKALNMTEADLASAAGVGEAAIKKLERGETKAPSLQNAVRIADALHVDIWTLAFGTERPTAENSTATDSPGDIASAFAEFSSAEMDRRVKRLVVMLWNVARAHRRSLREIQSALQLDPLPQLDNDPQQPKPRRGE